MLKHFVWPGFILLVLAQWFVPGQMIWNKEKVLDKGIPFKFESAPVDPADPFRGRYVVLNFKETSYQMKDSTSWIFGSRVFVSFINDKKGFAKIQSVSASRPAAKGYIEATVNYVTRENDTTTVFINYPVNNFYMEEYKAPQAESIYRESVIDSSQRTYALVNILDGDAVIKDVLINDSSIHEVIRQRNLR